ncbi:signal peptidase complex catalytic subunit sec11 [Cenococcum geophilum 1.58]|uniref:signal peptidase complex catalytic subunit sec11 n=1 Tax=Cenococcum geophilum 1.58 TaxID=794803 RepID=UPI00358FC43D|nr:signal peptidase complex catalytic subunit sec11 [Cenococcum geophilum 1.58]
MAARRFALQVMPYCLIVSSVFMLWESLRIITGSRSPLVVVISASMEPTFNRGDILFVWNRDEKIEVGDIAVCWFEGRNLPMVHRVIKSVTIGERPELSFQPQHQLLLTKGDNNNRDDTELYPPGRPYLNRTDVIGTVRGYVPFVGWITILLRENSWVESVMWICSGLVLVFQ